MESVLVQQWKQQNGGHIFRQRPSKPRVIPILKIRQKKPPPSPEEVVARHERRKQKQREYNAKVRRGALERLGNKCCRCGFSDPRALQIDHINGGGCAITRQLSPLWVYGDVQRLPEDELHRKYQLLCANCNWIKRFENNEAGKRFSVTISKKVESGRGD